MIRIRDEHPGSYFLELTQLRNNFLGPGSGMEKIWIPDPGINIPDPPTLLNLFIYFVLILCAELSPGPGTTAACSCTQRPTTSSTRSRTAITGSSGRWTCPSTSPGSRAARSSAWTGTASPGFSTSIQPSSASSSLLSTGEFASSLNCVPSCFAFL
jgi:hypothetical protein